MTHQKRKIAAIGMCLMMLVSILGATIGVRANELTDVFFDGSTNPANCTKGVPLSGLCVNVIFVNLDPNSYYELTRSDAAIVTDARSDEVGRAVFKNISLETVGTWKLINPDIGEIKTTFDVLGIDSQAAPTIGISVIPSYTKIRLHPDGNDWYISFKIKNIGLVPVFVKAYTTHDSMISFSDKTSSVQLLQSNSAMYLSGYSSVVVSSNNWDKSGYVRCYADIYADPLGLVKLPVNGASSSILFRTPPYPKHNEQAIGTGVITDNYGYTPTTNTPSFESSPPDLRGYTDLDTSAYDYYSFLPLIHKWVGKLNPLGDDFGPTKEGYGHDKISFTASGYKP